MAEQLNSLEHVRRFVQATFTPFTEHLEVKAEVTQNNPGMQTCINQQQHDSPMHFESRRYVEQVKQAEAAILQYRDIAFEQPWGTYAYQRVC